MTKRVKPDNRNVPFCPSALDDGMFCVAAFRYAMGRASYAVGCVANVLIRCAPKMYPNDKQLIVKEIREAISEGSAGWPCDAADWKRVLEAMKDEPA